MTNIGVKIEISGKTPPFEGEARVGENLRKFLIRCKVSPHTGAWKSLNCKGNGICGSCAIQVWEDGAYWSRKSCQIRCYKPMKIRLE